MLAADQPCYTLIHSITDLEPVNEMQIKQELEKGDNKQKAETMKKIIMHIINGEKLSGILMTVIRFVMPTLDHTLKKLLQIFWEVVPKYGPDGKLLHEMILVCDAYRRDLQHPNEYIRGATLRFLCKLKEAELLEPLMPAIRDCLKYRHAYVRRNAVLAIFTIYKNYDFLIPDAVDLVAQFLDNEQDASCKRNAFLMLLHVDQDRALSYLSQYVEQVQSFNDILQLVVVQLIYKVCQTNAGERARFIRCIYSLLNSTSPAVRYEAAGTLVTLSNAPTAIRAAAQCYIELVMKESDNNVKLIVLDRLVALNQLPSHHRVLQELVMDVLRILGASDLEVRRKTLDLALELVTAKNVEEVVLLLKKETVKSSNAAGNDEETHKYRRLLVRAVHQCSIRFIDVASGVIPMLCDFLTDPNETSGLEVLVFLREAIHKYSNLRADILVKLLDALPNIKSVRIYRAAIWLLGEFCDSVEEIQSTIAAVRRLLGDLPLVESELRERDRLNRDREPASREEAAANALLSQASAPTVRTLITSDGTYATQAAITAGGSAAQVGAAKASASQKDIAPLRKHLLDGEFFLGAAIGTTLTKLALKYVAAVSDSRKQNALVAECMLIVVSILNLGRSPLPSKRLNEDDNDRLVVCIKVLADRGGSLIEVFARACRDSLTEMLAAQAEEERKSAAASKKQPNGAALDESAGKVSIEVDQPITFAQLLNKNDLATLGDTKLDSVQLALQGTGTSVINTAGGPGKRTDDLLSASKLNKVTQLTGFSDPVYAEAYISVNQYDVVLDVLIVNQTSDTLQNLTLELSTLGDLKLVEKPAAVTLAPHDFATIKASVKVASTENGIIFGNLVYDLRGAASDRNCVVLNDVHIDIMDYIIPATCSDAEFRRMWVEFEWENKIQVNTNITDLREYLDHLLSSTNMRCLTPAKALSGECGFMAACLYARSIFGEDALANVSLEKPSLGPANAPVTGHIRIRAKSQGMALSLGDKVNASQKKSSLADAEQPSSDALAKQRSNEDDLAKSSQADADEDDAE